MKKVFLLIVVILFAAAPLRADDKAVMDLSIEQLMEIEIPTVFGASKFEQKVTDAPASVSVVTAEEIRKYGHRTLADILRSVRGFYVSNDRNYSYLGARGFSRPSDYNSRFLLLLDGHRLNDNIYDTASVGMEFPLDVDLIERVEIIRGPSSSIYGSSAFFGVINVISRRGLDMKGAEAAGSAGSQETYGGRLSYGNKYKNGLELLFSGTSYKSGGAPDLYFKEYDTPADNNGIASHVDDEKSYNLFSKVSFKDLTLTAAYVNREKGIPTGSYGTVFNDNRNRTLDAHGYVDLKYAKTFENYGELTARVYFDHYKYRGDYMYSGANPGDPLISSKDGADGQWAGGEIMYTQRLLGKHLLTVGAEGRFNLNQDQINYDESPFLSRLDDQRRSKTYGLYLQDEYHIWSKLIFNFGLRYDYYDTSGGTANPRLALIYKPLEKSIIKLLYGSAFRAPNAYELYYHDSGFTSKANTELQPEKIKTYELVYEQYLGEKYRMSLSGFYYQIDGLITQQADTADGLLTFRNIGKAEGKGVEAEVAGKWANGIQGRASYILQEARDQETGELLTNAPRHLAKLNLNVPLIKKKLFAGAEVQYTSSRKTLAGETGGFVTTNLTLFSQNVLKGLDVSFSFYNLLDKRYADPGAGEHRQDVIEQDGRTFRLKLTYRF